MRARLVAAALEEIAEQGYMAFTIHKACRRAKVTTGAFQHHFETKMDIVEEIIAGFIPKVIEAISGDDDDAGLPMAARCSLAVNRCQALFDTKMVKVIWEIYVCGRWDPRLKPVISSCIRVVQATWAQEFERVFGRDLKAGSDSHALALFVMSQLRGAAILSLVEDRSGDREYTIKLLTDVIMSHCRPDLQLA